MATTLKSGSLEVIIQEKLVINGINKGSRVISVEDTVGEVSRRTLDVTNATNGTAILKFAAAAGAGVYNHTTLKYCRITNLDATDSLILHLEETDANHDTQVLVPPKKSFLLSSAVIDNEADIDNGVVSGGSENYIDIITGKATGSSSIKVEYIIFNT